MPLNAHRMVEEQAREMANELFEVYARDDAFYRALRARGEITEPVARRIFIDRLIPKLYEDARAALSTCLGRPDDEISATLKEEIYEALCADDALRGNRLVAKERGKVPKSREKMH